MAVVPVSATVTGPQGQMTSAFPCAYQYGRDEDFEGTLQFIPGLFADGGNKANGSIGVRIWAKRVADEGWYASGAYQPPNERPILTTICDVGPVAFRYRGKLTFLCEFYALSGIPASGNAQIEFAFTRL